MTFMDIGRIGSDSAVFKRKFRWLFHLSDQGVVAGSGTSDLGAIVASTGNTGHIAKITARPSITLNEQEVRHVIETVFLPARAQWNPIEITVYDVDNESYLYDWLKLFYDPELGTVSPVGENTSILSGLSFNYPKKIGVLQLLNGHGIVMETWQFQGCWPSLINWGTLDYASSETADISFTLHYDRAIRS